MRYYDIRISDPKTGKFIVPKAFRALGLESIATSSVRGIPLPGALKVELDIPVSVYANPRGAAFVKIWGIGLEDIGQAADLNFKNIEVRAGMQKGLPLANPKQAGLVLQGTIIQAFGNWIGTEQTLDLQVIPPAGTVGTPINLSFNWPANTPLSRAIETTIKTGMPLYTVKTYISDQLILSSPQYGPYGTLSAFSKMIKSLTTQQQFKGIKTLSGNKYAGVEIMIKGREVIVYDGTVDFGENTSSKPLDIKFQDMIGQPTWLSAAIINIKTVLRSDISLGDYIKLDPNLTSPYVLTQRGSAFPGTPSRDKSVFLGKFVILEAHHFGSSRQRDAESWATVFNAAAIVEKTSSSSGSAAP